AQRHRPHRARRQGSPYGGCIPYRGARGRWQGSRRAGGARALPSPLLRRVRAGPPRAQHPSPLPPVDRLRGACVDSSMGARVFALLVILVTSARAASRCELRGKPWIEGRVRGSRGLLRAVDARRGEEIEVFVAAPGRLNGRAVVFGEGRGRVPW